MGRKKHLGAIEPILQDNTELGVPGYQYRIAFLSLEEMQRNVQDIINRRYRAPIVGDLTLQQAFPIMCIFNGLSDTSYRQAQRAKGKYPKFTQENVITSFENKLAKLSPSEQQDQLLGICYSYYYNSVRSTIGNSKSNRQKEAVKAKFATFTDPRLARALKLKEIAGHNIDPKSDGVLLCTTRKYRTQGYIHIFLRTGDCMGGSQGDRMGQIKSVAEKYPTTDFILIWDGIEVDHKTIDQINSIYSANDPHRGAVYINTTDDLEETKILELFDRP